ncbi:MAG: UDP-N-acetylglucosamine 2-epimerase [Bacillota bacterium]|nr:UDP-N-acetylglucosamine 2-epimerase [Bacillota bacterium]
MRRVMVFTATRAEYGLLRPVIERIAESRTLELRLVVAGAHLAPWSGFSVREIERDGFPVAVRIENLPASDCPGTLARFVGVGLIEIASHFDSERPDIVLLLGDRYELFIPALAALLHRVPLAHLCGGEATEGSIDEQVRHAITKMAHIHFPSTIEYGRRIRRMGEEAWRIHVVGAPGVENILRGHFAGADELRREFGIDPDRPTLLVTYHPETLTSDTDTRGQVSSLIHALRQFPDLQQVITYPGTEVGFRAIVEAWEEYAAGRTNVILRKSLGSRGYLGLMRRAVAVVGNSSSGIIEAPSLKVPTVNIGDRQKGRIRADSVIDVSCTVEEIIAGIRRALYDEEFRRRLDNVVNPYDPYGDGNVSGRVIKVLEEIPLDRRLLEKKLDFPSPEEVESFGR